MFNINLAIKFGSNEIVIYRKGIGIIAKEPAYLAVTENNSVVKVKAIGKDAEKLFNAKSGDLKVYRPIENSEIVNEKMAIMLISKVLDQVILDKFFLTSINALVAVPSALNEKQLLLIKKVLQLSGISKVTFVQNSVCVYNSLNINPTSNIMIVDIGKYVTDISVLNEFNFNFGRMCFVGGQDMDKSITTFILDNKGLKITDIQSEQIKNEVASLYENDMYSVDFTGFDTNKKCVKSSITANEVRVAITSVYEAIFKMVDKILAELPKEICRDIYENGIVFVGGGSSISGLYEYAKKHFDLGIIVPDNPNDCTILGASKLIDSDKEFLKLK